MAKTEPCTGITRSDIQAEDYHCPGCTSASERIAELERRIDEQQRAEASVHEELYQEQKKLTAMRTLAGELAELLKIWHGYCHDDTPCDVREAFKKAKELGVVDGG